jgi:hypothetical protein
MGWLGLFVCCSYEAVRLSVAGNLTAINFCATIKRQLSATILRKTAMPNKEKTQSELPGGVNSDQNAPIQVVLTNDATKSGKPFSLENIDADTLFNQLYNKKPEQIRRICCDKKNILTAIGVLATFVIASTPPLTSAIADFAEFIPNNQTHRYSAQSLLKNSSIFSPLLMHLSGGVIHSTLSEGIYDELVEIRNKIQEIQDSIYSAKMSSDEKSAANYLYGEEDLRKAAAGRIMVPAPPLTRRVLAHVVSAVGGFLSAAAQIFGIAGAVLSFIAMDDNVSKIGFFIRSIANCLVTVAFWLLLTSALKCILPEKIKPLSEVRKSFTDYLETAQKERFKLLFDRAKSDEKSRFGQIEGMRKDIEKSKIKVDNQKKVIEKLEVRNETLQTTNDGQASIVRELNSKLDIAQAAALLVEKDNAKRNNELKQQQEEAIHNLKAGNETLQATKS